MTREEAIDILREIFSGNEFYFAEHEDYPIGIDGNFQTALLMAIEALSHERPKGRWEWKHRMKGGFHTYTGLDSMGETHTITVDECYETEEPYCPNCGKWNDSQWLNFCPNCGADMRGVEE